MLTLTHHLFFSACPIEESGWVGISELPKVNPPHFLKVLWFYIHPWAQQLSFASILCKFLSVFFMVFAGLKIGCIIILPYFSSNF